MTTPETPKTPRAARIIVDVVAGLMPGGDPDPEFSRRFVVWADEWHAAGSMGQSKLLSDIGGQAASWALLLANPGRVNWVRMDWVYL